MRNMAIGGLLITLAAPVFGQASGLQDLVSGKDAPATIRLKDIQDLGSDWKRITITPQGSGGGMGDLMNQIMPLAMMGGGGPKKDDMMGMAFLNMFGGGGSQPAYYTKGATTTIGGETFLIAYKAEKPQMDFMQLIMESAKNGGKEPDMAKMMGGGKLTPDSTLGLTLVNARSIGTISGIRAFNMDQEIADSAKGPGGLMDLMALGQTKLVETPAAPVPASKPIAPAKKKNPGK